MSAALATPLARQIAGKSILVTGGASGLGAATSALFASHGAHVTILDLDAAVGEAFARSLNDAAAARPGATGLPTVQFVKTDVRDPEQVAVAIAAAEELQRANQEAFLEGAHSTSTDAAAVAAHPPYYEHVFGCINCAGLGPAAKVLGRKGPMELSFFQNIIEVNLIGTFNVTRLAAASMAQNAAQNPSVKSADAYEVGADTTPYFDNGVIVNTSSIAAFDGQIGQAAYSASKGGITSLTLPLARELAAHRIRVNTICPGVARTPLLEKFGAKVVEALSANVPYPRRLLEPREYAEMALFLVQHRYMNGETIRMDGALRMAPK
ncbi:3-hydroxyacyl-CoA dehydrogenase [Strigomonas culicis]|uniref:3-hydroxyacyl-CoA dehydrogenase n=1 Tax=Strigomonas culicis TaxID=28005 RepID=S9UG64_9TRYP|nr:3-hydroxyacyl-CoA dehydrogenase [Strigomonas culicis]|eukprot:EPY27729.1 3-hydroxyacyl-CoA dehydrogenase [Strigomonas culicis]